MRIVGCLGKAEFKNLEAPRPLFNLDALASRPEARVLLVEGEKAALAAQGRFPEYVATTWVGGARSTKKVYFDPLVGRHVTIWPDHDADGLNGARTMAQELLKAGAAFVKLVNVPDTFPPKWDLADAAGDGQ